MGADVCLIQPSAGFSHLQGLHFGDQPAHPIHVLLGGKQCRHLLARWTSLVVYAAQARERVLRVTASEGEFVQTGLLGAAPEGRVLQPDESPRHRSTAAVKVKRSADLPVTM